MALAPVEYLLCRFPGNEFTGELAPALADLIDQGHIRILDLLFVLKDREGNVGCVEIDQRDELLPYLELDGEAGGLLSDEDVERAATSLDPDSSAMLLVWEDLWASRFADALRNSGGVIVEGGRISHELIEAAPEAAD
jgi:hypothetical protein